LVIPEGERNTVDQEIIVATLQREHGIRTVRRTFNEMLSEYKVGEDGVLKVNGKEIALVYYRAGYQLEHY
jgi:glutathione synthase